MDFLNGLMNEMTSGSRPLLSLLFVLNILLLILARPLLAIISPDQDNKSKVKIAQALNLLVLVFQIIDFGLGQSVANYDGAYLTNLGMSLMAIYTGVFLYSLSGTYSRKKFGSTRELDSKTIYIETYNSRLVNIILLAMIVLTVIYVLIKIWGADSWLETTGIFGIFLAFMAFTSSIWAPDIVSGLIILNSDILVDGDVVVVDGYPDEFIIARVTLIYVVLYDVRNNHRTLLRNTQFIQSRIDNLSRIASTEGIRQCLKYNIGYPSFSDDRKTRVTELTAFQSKIDTLFMRSFETCKARDEIRINKNKPFEWAMTSAGDYALEYTLWIYLDRIPNTKVTATIRRHLMGTMYKINEAVFTASVLEGVDLSTPDLIQAKIETTPRAKP